MRLSLRPDRRRFDNPRDARSTCRRCGTHLVLLPDDRRQGYCFGCFDILEVRREELA